MTRWTRIAGLAALSLVVPVIGAIFGPGSIHAQGNDNDHVDVALILEVPDTITGSVRHDLDIVVVNQGFRTAYDVEVVVTVEYPEDTSRFLLVPEVPVGSASIEDGGYSLRWSIPALGGLQREEVTAPVRHEVFATDMLGTIFDNSDHPHEFSGTVTTSSFESNLRKGNNKVQVWSYSYSAETGASYIQAEGNYSVTVSVDNPAPSPNDTVNFTITALRENPIILSDGLRASLTAPPIDLNVDIELTDGLTVSGTPSYGYPGTTKPGSVSYSDGVFNIGTLKRGDGEAPRYSVTLPVTVASSALVNEQCLTATLTGNPPPGVGPHDDDISDNVAKVCLGESPDEKVVFRDGTADLWALYPCVGVTASPCDDTDSVVLAINGLSAAVEAGVPYAVFIPDNVVVHIPDDVGRHVFGGELFWTNGHDADNSANGAGILPGVVAKFDRSLIGTDNYSQLRASIVANTPGEAGDKGHVSIVFASSFTVKFFDTAEPRLSYGPNDFSSKPPLFFRFTKLGTYTVDLTMGALYDSDPTDTTLPADPADLYSDTATYTFHVGPMAELEVRDGGASSHAGADQNALTIVAVNNGPDEPVGGAQVTGLPMNAAVIHVSHGSYDGTTGEWDIGELKVRGYYRSRGETDPTLVLSASAGDTASVSIANSENYEVCIASDGDDLAHTSEASCVADTANGGSWHEGTVYDYNSVNNTATITARAGTGGVHPDAPTLQAPAVHAPAVGIAWSEVGFLYGVPVKDYQVQWSIDGVSGWTQLETDLTLPELFDITIQSGVTRYYRVRAVNQAGVPGPWSSPMSAMPVDTTVPGITISETDLTVREGESADYTVRLHGRPHSSVTVRINGGGVVSPNPGALTFNTNDFNMPKTIKLTGIQDNNPDNEQVNVTHTISSSDAGYRSLTPDPVVVTVIDDDSGVLVTADQASVNEGEDITFTLTRTGNTDSAITVDLSVSQRGSFLPADQLGTRSVNIGAGVDAATVTVETENDTVLENAGSVTLVVNIRTGYLLGTPRSATVNVQDDDGPPGQPRNLAAEEGDQQVALSWDAAPVGDAPVLDYSYRVRRSDRSNWDPNWTVLSGGSGRRNHTESSLTNGQEYMFQVRARNATGDGAVAKVRANPKAEPGRPDVTVSSRSEALVVTWSVADDGGRDVTQYQVQWKSGGESFDTSRQATATTAEYTIPSLTNGTEYQVRVRAMNEVDWGDWSFEQPGTPTPRPATSLRITTDATDGVSEPFRVTFTFTDEDHEGNRFGVEGFDVDDIEVRYSPTVGYEFSLKDFREEVAGFRYSARLEDVLEGTLNITVKAGAAQSTEDGQQSTAASHSIRVEVPEAVVPTGRQIWAAEMTVGEDTGNARGYINHNLTNWNLNDTVGGLSDGDGTTDDDDAFTYAGTNHTVGEVSFVPAWNMVMFILCPGLEAADATFDLYLDDQEADHADLTLNFDPDEVESGEFNNGSCVEYRWTPRQVDWQKDGKINVRLVR